MTHEWFGPIGLAYGDTLRTTTAGTYTCRSRVGTCASPTVSIIVSANSPCYDVSAMGFGVGGAASWTTTADSLSTPQVLPQAQAITITNTSASAIDFGLILYPPPGFVEGVAAAQNVLNVQVQIDQNAAPPATGAFVYARDRVPTEGVAFADGVRWAGGGWNVLAGAPDNARQIWLKLTPPIHHSPNPLTLRLHVNARAHVP